MLEVLVVVLAVSNAAGAPVLGAPMLTGLVVFLVAQVEAIGAENLPNDTTAIGVRLVLGVLAAS